MESIGEMYYHCSFCDYKCDLQWNLEEHIRVHTREKPFYCEQCKRGYATKRYLKIHTLRVHQGIREEYKKRYKCSHCSYATYATCALKAHTQLHHEDLSFPCPHPDCQYTGKSSHNLQKHITTMHTKTKRKFVCEFPNCEFRAKTMADIRTHSANHSENRPFICDFEGCSYRAKFKVALEVHKRGVHHGGHKPFACSVCNHCCTSKDLLTAHERTHAEKSFKCNFSGCAYSCKLKSYLNKHVRNCHAEKTFKCDFVGCSFAAASQLMLKQHKEGVHGEKIYKCPSCDYRTSHKSAIGLHIDRHRARRIIPCPNNGCTFLTANRKDLYKHLKNHKGCPVEGCSHVSHSSSSFKKHMQRHDPTGRPCQCPLCPQYFPTNYELSHHLRRHTKEKPLKCPECTFATVDKNTINNHVRAFHSGAFPEFSIDEKSTCDHCSVNFGSAVALAMHKIKLKTAVVVLTRLQLKFDS